MDTIAFRDLRHTILTQCDHRCHYCGNTAHQIHHTVDATWVPMCRTCFRKTGYTTFKTEAAKRSCLDNRDVSTDADMILLNRHLAKSGLL